MGLGLDCDLDLAGLAAGEVHGGIPGGLGAVEDGPLPIDDHVGVVRKPNLDDVVASGSRKPIGHHPVGHIVLLKCPVARCVIAILDDFERGVGSVRVVGGETCGLDIGDCFHGDWGWNVWDLPGYGSFEHCPQIVVFGGVQAMFVDRGVIIVAGHMDIQEAVDPIGEPKVGPPMDHVHTEGYIVLDEPPEHSDSLALILPLHMRLAPVGQPARINLASEDHLRIGVFQLGGLVGVQVQAAVDADVEAWSVACGDTEVPVRMVVLEVPYEPFPDID